MSGPRSRDEDATLGEQKGSPREGSTAYLERIHSGRRKGGPEETTRMQFWRKGESPVGQEESFYIVMRHAQFPPLTEPWQRLWLVIQLSFSY